MPTVNTMNLKCTITSSLCRIYDNRRQYLSTETILAQCLGLFRKQNYFKLSMRRQKFHFHFQSLNHCLLPAFRTHFNNVSTIGFMPSQKLCNRHANCYLRSAFVRRYCEPDEPWKLKYPVMTNLINL
jgi:hypothetical protein